MVGHLGSFFFSKRGSSIATMHSSMSCTTSVVGKTLLFPRIPLIYLVHGKLHSIKKCYVDIEFLDYLDELAELLIGHQPSYPFWKR